MKAVDTVRHEVAKKVTKFKKMPTPPSLDLELSPKSLGEAFGEDRDDTAAVEPAPSPSRERVHPKPRNPRHFARFEGGVGSVQGGRST